uniref:Vp80 n=1 Tax=Spodoptera frugiperda nuclear polyhedrosis virus TaxID=10455 RepID=B2KWZ4_NPVSF|nr:P87 [Spodoptera frugiperda multiple nucleopolyhedrovirus]QWS70801.1 vp80 [Spodoptera frugiperda multiple nucleopolyhedrovirus]
MNRGGNIENTIERNTFEIKYQYARLLSKYLLKIHPNQRETIKNFMLRVKNAESSSIGIAKYALDNVIDNLRQILESTNEDTLPQPSTSSFPPPSARSIGSSDTTVLIERNDDENDDDDVDSESNSEDDSENDTNGNDDLEMNMIKIKSLTKQLLDSNSLQSLTKQSLFDFEKLIQNDVYEDYFKDGIELDSVDCDLNDDLQRFIKIYKKYGPVNCVVTDVNYYAERVRNNPELLESLPPTVRAAVVSILDLVAKKQAYTLEININPQEFNQITNNVVKNLLNRYSEHRPIKFTAPSSGNVAAVAVSSTDEEDYQQMTQTMRRKRKMRAPLPNVSKSKRVPDQTTPGTMSSSSSTTSNMVSDEAFIDNVKQRYQSNTIVPKLIMQIVTVVPVDVPSSLLTCPTNGLSDVKVSAQNYNSTITNINKMNLTVINENVYFYKLLEPLAYYGSSDALITKVLWFIARSANYFINSARNFNYLRSSLTSLTNDVDRVGLFMIRYNFLWFYRQFLDQLLSSPTTPYQNQKIINVLHVYDTVVQKEYNRIQYRFNQNRVYVGPVDNVIKLMVVSTSDILA